MSLRSSACVEAYLSLPRKCEVVVFLTSCTLQKWINVCHVWFSRNMVDEHVRNREGVGRTHVCEGHAVDGKRWIPGS